MLRTKFGAYRMNRFEVIQFLVKCRFSSAAILVLALPVSGDVKTQLHAKFGENRTNGSGVIKDFVNFKMAAGGHFVLLILLFPAADLLPVRS